MLTMYSCLRMYKFHIYIRYERKREIGKAHTILAYKHKERAREREREKIKLNELCAHIAIYRENRFRINMLHTFIFGIVAVAVVAADASFFKTNYAMRIEINRNKYICKRKSTQ